MMPNNYTEEVWKDFSDTVSVSSFGRVKSKARFVQCSNRRVPISERIYKPAIDKKGYLRVAFLHNGKHTTFKVHRLVAMLFVDNTESKPQVNHKDGKKDNNHFQNLEWCNNSENVQHAYDTGLAKPKHSFENHRFSFTKESLVELVELKRNGAKVIDLAKRFNVHRKTITRVYNQYVNSPYFETI